LINSRVFVGGAHVFGEDVLSTVEARVCVRPRPVWNCERHSGSVKWPGNNDHWHCIRYTYHFLHISSLSSMWPWLWPWSQNPSTSYFTC